MTLTGSLTPNVASWSLSSPWAWKPDVGTGGISPNTCAWNEKTCTRTYSKTGWMVATAVIEIYTVKDSARAYKVPCPTGDSIVDQEVVRNALLHALAASNPGAANELDMKEHGGYVLRDRITGQIVIQPELSPASNCWILGTVPPPIDFAKYELLAEYHTHPYQPYQATIQCRDPITGEVTSYNPLWGYGPSEPDAIALTTLNAWLVQTWRPAVAEYVIDPVAIYRLPPWARRSDTAFNWNNCPNFRI